MSDLDHDDLKLQLEAMKLNQGSLQQLMILSAGGLALYFGFIGKAPFLQPLREIGVLVVTSWIASLCAAMVAHRLHGKLFLSLYHLSNAAGRARALERLPEDVDEELKQAVHREAVLERAREKLQTERSSFESYSKAFNAVFFPTQDRVNLCTTIALYGLVAGFVFLGVAYVMWSIGA